MPKDAQDRKGRGPFPLFWRDFLSGTHRWSADERLGYLSTLVFLWEQGGRMPDSDALLRSLTEAPPSRARARIVAKVRSKLTHYPAAPSPVGSPEPDVEGSTNPHSEGSAICSANPRDRVQSAHIQGYANLGHDKLDAIIAKRQAISALKKTSGAAGGRANATRAASIRSNDRVASILVSKKEGSCTTDRTIADVKLDGSKAKPPAPATTTPKATTKMYAFEGTIVRLSSVDLEKWRAQFPRMNLERELTGIDAWLVEHPPTSGSWFWLAHRMLVKRAEAIEPAFVDRAVDAHLVEKSGIAGKYLLDTRTGETYIRSPTGALVPINSGGI